MNTHVEYTDEFGLWWESLTEAEQISVAATVGLLKALSRRLGYPHSSAIVGSKVSHLRELRVQHQGKPYRVLYAFDPRRDVILLLGGNKVGQDRWYDIYIPKAQSLYEAHLQALRDEGLIKSSI
jgi:hypothetical protein